MDFWIKYGLYIIYAAGATIGIGLIIAGIITLHKDKRLSKRKVYRAKVLNCIIGDQYIPGIPMECFDIILEITTARGTVRREVKRRDPMDIGTTVEVYYDSRNDVVRFTDEAFDEEKAYPIVLIAVGIFFIVALLAMAITSKLAKGGVIGSYPIGILFGMIFAFVGIYCSVIRPHKINKEMIHCEQVEGRVADVVRQGKTNDGKGYTYSCLYEYEYGGVTRTIKGRTSSNTIGHSMIGNKATMVINHKTGEVFCMDDEKTAVGIGIGFLLFGLGTIAVMIFAMLILPF